MGIDWDIWTNKPTIEHFYSLNLWVCDRFCNSFKQKQQQRRWRCTWFGAVRAWQQQFESESREKANAFCVCVWDSIAKCWCRYYRLNNGCIYSRCVLFAAHLFTFSFIYFFAVVVCASFFLLLLCVACRFCFVSIGLCVLCHFLLLLFRRSTRNYLNLSNFFFGFPPLSAVCDSLACWLLVCYIATAAVHLACCCFFVSISPNHQQFFAGSASKAIASFHFIKNIYIMFGHWRQ